MGGRIIALWACALALPVAGAVAQERPDPDSPAGVEYELPLEGARRDASGDPDRKTTKRTPSRSPLFGEGISKGEGSPGSPEEQRSEEDAEDPASGAADPPQSARLAASTADDGADTTLTLGGIAVAVLLGGGVLGLLLRRGLGRSEAP